MFCTDAGPLNCRTNDVKIEVDVTAWVKKKIVSNVVVISIHIHNAGQRHCHYSAYSTCALYSIFCGLQAANITEGISLLMR